MFEFLRKSPKWATQLPPHIELTKPEIDGLELIRKEFGIDNEEFQLYIMGHPQITRRTLLHQYRHYKSPGLTEKDVLQVILAQRFFSHFEIGNDLLGLRSVAEDESKYVARLEEIMMQHTNIESLIDAILEYEERQEPTPPAQAGYEKVATRVNEILKPTLRN